MTRGMYKDGVKIGKWLEFNKEGVLAKETRYKNGEIKSENVIIEEAGN